MAIECDGNTTITFRATGKSRVVGYVLSVLSAYDLLPWLFLDGCLGMLAFYAIRGDLPDQFSPYVPHSMEGVLGGGLALLFVGWTIALVRSIAGMSDHQLGVDKLVITPNQWIISRWGSRKLRLSSQCVLDLHVARADKRPLLVDTDTGRHEVTCLGTPEERDEAVQRLRPLIPERSIDDLRPLWTVTGDPDGTIHVAKRRFNRYGGLATIVMVTLVLLILTIRFAAEVPAPMIILGRFLMACGIVLSAWIALVRRDWIVRHDYLAERVRWLGWSRIKAYDPASLSADQGWSEEKGAVFMLVGKVKGARMVFYCDYGDDHDAMRLARFIETVTGWTIPVIPPPNLVTPQALWRAFGEGLRSQLPGLSRLIRGETSGSGQPATGDSQAATGDRQPSTTTGSDTDSKKQGL